MTVPVIRVLAPNPGPFTLEGTNTWIVGRDPSLVIDPGPDDRGHVLAVLAEADPVGAILLTHHHPDHAPAARELAEATGVRVRAFAPRKDEVALRHGEVVEVAGTRVRTIHTPGHTSDHVCFLLEDDGRLFTGDVVLGRGTSVVDPPDGDMSSYVRSLQRLLELDPSAIYPGHGPVIFTPRGRLEYYLRHRTDRERQVLAALADGRHTAAEMIPGIYGEEIPEGMYRVAARSVLAHLLKLEREGRVARTGRHRDERFVLVTPRACERCGGPSLPGSRFCRRCGLAVLQEGPAPGQPDGD